MGTVTVLKVQETGIHTKQLDTTMNVIIKTSPRTFKVEGWKDGELIAEECGVEESSLDDMVETLEEEGFDVTIVLE